MGGGGVSRIGGGGVSMIGGGDVSAEVSFNASTYPHGLPAIAGGGGVTGGWAAGMEIGEVMIGGFGGSGNIPSIVSKPLSSEKGDPSSAGFSNDGGSSIFKGGGAGSWGTAEKNL